MFSIILDYESFLSDEVHCEKLRMALPLDPLEFVLLVLEVRLCLIRLLYLLRLLPSMLVSVLHGLRSKIQSLHSLAADAPFRGCGKPVLAHGSRYTWT